VLVVDDDALVSTGTVAMLEDLGHTALEARSGQEALDILAARPDIAVVVTDQIMPQMTGLELTRRIRGSFPKVRVILATGFSDMGSPGPDKPDLPILSKPFTQGDLAAAIAGVGRAEAA
jgi:CheY-like chemotaxis protein